MKIQHPPIRNYKHRNAPVGSISQWFGENHELYFSRIGIQAHNGLDLVAPWGTPLYAVEDGIVADVKNSPDGYGKHLRILSERSGSEWTYGHNSENFVEIGQEVKAGDHIANMGNTGFVVSSHDGAGFWKAGSNKWAGTHLHLGRREIKIVKRGGWQYNPNTPRIEVLNYNNGYFGAVNFAHMMTDLEFVADESLEDRTTLIRFLNWLKDLGVFKK
jgi:hypothetical protein